MKNWCLFILMIFVSVLSNAGSTHYDWYNVIGAVYCGEFTSSNDRIQTMNDNNVCRHVSPTHYDWYNVSGAVYCGEFTSNNDRVQTMNDNNVCRRASPTYYNWYNYGGSVYCGEFTGRDDRVQTMNDNNVCRDHAKKTVTAAPVLPSVQEINGVWFHHKVHKYLLLEI
jgi:hypothetical protein